MKKRLGCDYEETIVKAIKSGLENDEVSQHLKTCASCRETAKIVRFFQTSLTNEPPPKVLPAAGLVWWKFRLREKRRASERVARPILIAQTVSVIAAFVPGVWLMFNRPSNLTAIESAFGRVFDSTATIVFPFFVGIICLSLICAVLILALRRVTSEK